MKLRMKKDKVSILAIAPYEGMKLLLKEVSKRFEDVKLDVFVGDLEAGLLIASRNFYNDYDIIISRGGTASMLKKRLNVPIIEIEISPLDILRAMKISENISDDYAIIGFPNITNNVQVICQIMELNIDIYSINSSDEVEDILKQVREKGTRGILCDMVAYTMALQFGLNPVLIKSGEDCIAKAIERARQVYYTHQNLREENKFLRRMIWNQINHTLVFDQNGSIFFSTLENNNQPIVSYLRTECKNHTEESDCRIIKQISNIRYSIRMTKEFLSEQEYTVYYFRETKVSLPDIRRGIRYLGYTQATKEYEGSIYGAIGLPDVMMDKIRGIKQASRPLLIYGEDGTCKEQAVKYIYMLSAWRSKPLVIVDCFMLDTKGWEYLMEHHNSPLAQDQTTLFIKNIDVLSSVQRKQLLANLLAMNVCGRNHVVLSSICNSRGELSESGRDFLETLCCMPLKIPPLREQSDEIRIYVQKYLNYADIRMKKPLGTAEPSVFAKLQAYPWPHNFTQFQRVLEELVTASENGTLMSKDVDEVLRRESTVATMNSGAEDANIRIDLSRSLEKICYDVVCEVLAEENGNKTETAKRLEIGRSTLWRILKKE